MLFDTHCHLYLWELNEDIDGNIERFKENGGTHLINIWVDIPSSLTSCEITKKHEGVFATIWIHPCYVLEQEKSPEEVINELKEIYEKYKDVIVWIWEAGLDNFHLSKDKPQKEKKLQNKYFRLQIRLSKELNLPIIIHTRDAWRETLKVLEEEKCDNFIIHCFSEDLDFANKCMEISEKCVFAFWGIVTYPKAESVKEAAKNIPLDRIVVETDAPYLAPQAYRWKLNRPEYVLEVVKFIANLRGEEFEKVQKQVFENSVRFFWVKK